MPQIIQIVGIVVVGFLAAASLRVVYDLLTRGGRRVRAVREAGGGLAQKFRGELLGGQGSPSIYHECGVHMTVRNGKIRYRPKSVVARQIS